VTDALAGLRILDLTRLLPGPLATTLLADFGADVIKIEEVGRGDYERQIPPIGPGDSGYRFHLVNRNKRSVALNLKDPRGVDVFRRLADEADVVVEGFRPGVVARLGIAYEQLRERNPRLIYCSISGYGQAGPYAHLAGHDINYLALGGVLSLTGTPELPALPGVQIADIGVAQMALVGILLALAARERTGRGQLVDVSMLDTAIFWLSGRAQWWFGEQTVPERGALPGTGASPGYNVYRTRDDKLIAVGCLEPHFWARLCTVLGLPELADEQSPQGGRREEIFALLRARFAERTRDEWFTLLREADACGTPVLDIGEVWDDPHVRDRGMLATVEHPTHGEILQIGVPIVLSETAGRVRAAAPDLGEHTDEILALAGCDRSERVTLRADGVVA
jgi:crotonobetainyl-CoA:carnitine CoA-transferase CaiB-like acyl-CoA transferase